jgi:hypothetical protein
MGKEQTDKDKTFFLNKNIFLDDLSSDGNSFINSVVTFVRNSEANHQLLKKSIFFLL